MSDWDVLVVEDDRDIRELLSEMLEGDGFRVVTAPNGREGLRILQGPFRPRLIMLDLMMPDVNGWQVLERLRQDPELSMIPVVLVTAYGGEVPLAAGYLRKPFHLESVVATVRRLIGDPEVAAARAISPPLYRAASAG